MLLRTQWARHLSRALKIRFAELRSRLQQVRDRRDIPIAQA
jgi:hypothetical protein